MPQSKKRAERPNNVETTSLDYAQFNRFTSQQISDMLNDVFSSSELAQKIIGMCINRIKILII